MSDFDRKAEADAGIGPPPEWDYRFHFKSGRLCLDLVATVGERWRRSFDRLRTPDDLARWLVEAGVYTSRPRVSGPDLERARELREAIYRLAHPRTREAPTEADVAALNAAAGLPDVPPVLTLSLSTSQNPALVCPAPGPDAAGAALSAVARDAVDLVAGPLRERIRECAADDCALLFVDASRPGRRRWCSMDGCGNRSKTSTYRRRLKNEDEEKR